MLRATSVLRKAAVRAERVVDTLSLGHQDRSRSALPVKAAGGLEFAIDLDKPTVLNDGDALKLEDGRLVQVKAAPESLLEIRAENPLRLVRLAWHLGGNHVPVEMTTDALYVVNVPSVAELVRGQGCAMAPVERPFQPEPEVHHHHHGDDCGCGHDHHDHGHHHHDHDHGHHHGHEHHGHEHHGHEHHSHDHHHGHEQAHAHDHHHAHGEGCGCGHDHAHDDHGHGHHDHSHGHGAAQGHKGHSHDH